MCDYLTCESYRQNVWLCKKKDDFELYFATVPYITHTSMHVVHLVYQYFEASNIAVILLDCSVETNILTICVSKYGRTQSCIYFL